MSLLLLHGKTAAGGGGGGGLTIATTSGLWARTSGSAATASSSFSVTSGDLLVAGFGGDGGLPDVPTNSGTAFTWTSRSSNTTWGQTRVFSAPATATQSMTVTIPADGMKCHGFVWVLQGQHASPIGVASGTNSTTNQISVSYTATAAGSITFMVASEWQETGVPTSSNLLSTAHGNYTGWTEAFIGHRANASSGSTSYDLNAAGAGGTNWSTSYLEILAA